MTDLVIRNVRPLGKAATDIAIGNGRIAAIAPNLPANGAAEEDGGGALLLPGLIEAHTHLDKTLLGMDWVENRVASSIRSKIDNEREMKGVLGLDPAQQSARQVVMSIAKGTTAIRSHVDIDTTYGLAGFEGVAATRERYADVMDLQIVAFPQSGMMIRKGTIELMDEALRQGADVVGGLDPCAIDFDPKGHLDVVFDLAVKHAKPIDIHLHEAGDLGVFTFGMILERTRAHGLAGKVTVSHAFALGMNDYLRIGQLLDDIAAAGVMLMSTGPAGIPVPPLIRGLDAGIAFCSGTDGMRDLWNPYGNADMLQRAQILADRNNLSRDVEIERALDVCTFGGARVMDLPDYGLEIGNFADLVLVEGRTVTEAVVTLPPRKLVVKRGRVVARDGEALIEAA
ncbi:amidohydrolase family protein [Kaistia terrae]|uniref:Amidohydrolase family protein n=1 Tax=Kaistia terrae TaxID=537017 RepID=A0ABW0Q2I8_9HYPH|nr:amidohydrolase family protein [Kaistia terrae]MCX5578901.1 amidohydrolase family protein [Kaistia terrae]